MNLTCTASVTNIRSQRWKGGKRSQSAKKQKSAVGVNHPPPRLAVGGDDGAVAPSAVRGTSPGAMTLYRKLKMSSEELEAALVLGGLADPRPVDGAEAIRSECEVVIGESGSSVSCHMRCKGSRMSQVCCVAYDRPNRCVRRG